MKKEITIKVPTDWSAITLRQYIELQKDLKLYEGEGEAIVATLYWHLCGLTPDIMLKIDTETFLKIKEQLFAFLNNTELPLIQTFKMDDVEYGFYPNLSKIEYGAYIDISKLNTTELNEDWAKVMAILYRPIKRKLAKGYEVNAYTGNEEWEWFLDLGMDLHFGAWFFFINTSMDLLSVIPNSILKKILEIYPNIKSTLVKNGVTIPQ